MDSDQLAEFIDDGSKFPIIGAIVAVIVICIRLIL
jgi:hypothetical protein